LTRLREINTASDWV